MRFSTKVRYGVRGLTELAAGYGKESLLLKDISRRQGISLKYMDHIFSMLKAKGLIRKQKAKKGGYLLSRRPSEITFFDIITALEGVDTMECLKPDANCPFIPGCGARAVWRKLDAKFEASMKSFTLEDVVKERENLSKASGTYDYHI